MQRGVGSILDRLGWAIALSAFIFGIVVAILVIASIDLAQDDDCPSPCHDGREISDECNDGNECSIDILDGDFGCTHANAPSSQACTGTANCYNDATFCNNGLCQGTNCTGTCASTGDCPQIEFNTTGHFSAGGCIGGACIYTIKVNSTAYGYCGVMGTIYLQRCAGFLAENGTYTACLEIDAQCVNSPTATFTTLVCTYKFACATSLLAPTGIPSSGKRSFIPQQYLDF